MKGFVGKAVALLGWAGALAGVVGCHTSRDLVDPCYPERYEYQARAEANGAFAPQVSNGHLLDQTIWNYHFEAGTDRLTPGGLEHLAYLARRRPAAAPVIYLQTAHDLTYNPDNPPDLVVKRDELDAKRAVAIKRYLAAQTAGGRAIDFQVMKHNPPPDIGLAAIPVGGTQPIQATGSLPLMYQGARGGLPGAGGASTSGGGGAGGGGGGGR
ncbi:MAG: hypothetical protein HYS12_01415 [Planctomycetes bacterium]|nr:hypothetical protein [Planctomycetota bacterium]